MISPFYWYLLIQDLRSGPAREWASLETWGTSSRWLETFGQGRCRGVGVRTYWLGGSSCKGKDITIWQQAISRSWWVYESGVKITLNVGLSKPFWFFPGVPLLTLLMGFLSAKNCPLLRWARTQVSERHDSGYIGAWKSTYGYMWVRPLNAIIDHHFPL